MTWQAGIKPGLQHSICKLTIYGAQPLSSPHHLRTEPRRPPRPAATWALVNLSEAVVGRHGRMGGSDVPSE